MKISQEKKRNEYNILSIPTKEKVTKLSKIFYFKPRKKPGKLGRELVVAYDERFPFVRNFKNRYTYYVKFNKKNDFAGNHYHLEKEEIYIPIRGDFFVILKMGNTQETIQLSSKKYMALKISVGVSHKVTSKGKGNILLVLANNHDSEEDNIESIID